MEIGGRLRAIRLHSGMTLAELSRDAGVSKSMLSNIERDRSAPTITTLQKIAGALGVELAYLVTDVEAVPEEPPATRGPFSSAGPDRRADIDGGLNGDRPTEARVVRRDQRKKVIMPWGADYEMLCPDMQHRIEFISITYPVDGGSGDLYSHEGEECGVVVEGRFRGIVGDQEYVLEPGDSIYYASSIPHRWENAGDVAARAVWAISPPSFLTGKINHQ